MNNGNKKMKSNRVNPWASYANLDAIRAFIEKQDEAYFLKTKVLTLDSHKIEVSNKGGKYRVAMVYLAQEKISGHQVCPHATESCKGICLGSHSGHASLVKKGTDFNACRVARVRKTIMFFNYRELFMNKLFTELTAFCKKCEKDGILPAFRFNATSDLPFHTYTIPDGSKTFIEYFGEKYGCQFYDYTKNIHKMEQYLLGTMPKNYSLTFSYTPEKAADAFKVVALGGTAAAAFATKKAVDYTGKKMGGFNVVNGDLTDLRFLDVKGVIIGLTAKGRTWKTDTSGFFVNTATLA
jgi:hypothetical protein